MPALVAETNYGKVKLWSLSIDSGTYGASSVTPVTPCFTENTWESEWENRLSVSHPSNTYFTFRISDFVFYDDFDRIERFLIGDRRACKIFIE